MKLPEGKVELDEPGCLTLAEVNELRHAYIHTCKPFQKDIDSPATIRKYVTSVLKKLSDTVRLIAVAP